jgi:hypothetical protein
MWRLYASASSDGRRTVRPVKPVFKAFKHEAALPVCEVGPVDNWALARLAASFGSEIAAALRSCARRIARGLMMDSSPEMKMARGRLREPITSLSERSTQKRENEPSEEFWFVRN